MKESKEKILISEIEEVKIEKEVLEVFIEKMFENNNMGKVFYDSFFVKNKFSFKDYRESGITRIIDAIGFNTKKRIPIAYEYKRKKDINHIDQARTYLNGLRHVYNGSARHKLEKEINKELKRGESEWECTDDFEVKIMCIAPFFGKQTSSLSEEEKKDIILSEIKIYKKNNVDILQINELGSKKSGLIKSSLFEIRKSIENDENSTKEEVKQEEIINTKKWIKEVEESIFRHYPNLFKQKKNSHGWTSCTYYQDERKERVFLTVNQRKRNIQVCFNLKKIEDEKERIKNEFELHDYKGNYRDTYDHEYLINSEEMLQKSLILVKKYLSAMYQMIIR